MFDATHPDVRAAVERALQEDLGPGDITTTLTVPQHLGAHGCFVAKQDFIAAGLEILPLIYQLGGGADVKLLAKSGDVISKSANLGEVQGPARVLLSCERVALNFLQRLSGVATLANQHVRKLGSSKTRVLDTRKTTPGLRTLEKMAVAAGGAVNHRKGLYDAVLIKNNHITAAGGVTKALAAVRDFSGPVEIEVRTRAELDQALAAGAKHLLLDNLSPVEAAEWIAIVNGRATVELSGNINLDNIASYANAGADFISCGAITHSAAAVDISFRLELES
jgi:nicotinate-nucleotide pyrophosphorylase (carboxylating)